MGNVREIRARLTQRPDDLVTAQATGVLVLALRVAPDVARHVLAAAARQHGAADEALATAVVAVAGGVGDGDPSLRRVAAAEWGDLLN
jgi:hypothetical protein